MAENSVTVTVAPNAEGAALLNRIASVLMAGQAAKNATKPEPEPDSDFFEEKLEPPKKRGRKPKEADQSFSKHQVWEAEESAEDEADDFFGEPEKPAKKLQFKDLQKAVIDFLGEDKGNKAIVKEMLKKLGFEKLSEVPEKHWAAIYSKVS